MAGATQAPMNREDIADQIQIGANRVVQRWEQRLARRVASTTDRENIVMGGAVPAVVERTGVLRRENIVDKVWTINNMHYDALVKMRRDQYLDDKTGRVAMLARQLGIRIASYPAKLISALVDAGATGLCYDGLPFYSTSHVHSGEAAQSNLLTGSGVDTLAKITTDVWAALAALFAFKDDKGEPVLEADAPLTFCIHHLPAQCAFLRQAITAAYLSSSDNILKNLYQFVFWEDGRLTAAGDWYVHAFGPDVQPFIFQEREAPQDIFVGPDETEVKLGAEDVKFGQTIRCAMAYGDWRYSVKVNN